MYVSIYATLITRARTHAHTLLESTIARYQEDVQCFEVKQKIVMFM